MRFDPPRKTQTWVVVLLLAAFVYAGVSRYAEEDGDDLAASYIGCRLVASGQGAHLYAHDPQNFAAVGPDDPWQQAADAGHYEGFTHPYVQTPLWAFALRPLCTRMDFAPFERIFAWFSMLSFAGAIWLVARVWTPAFLHPAAMAGLLLGLWYSQPFRYAMDLMQTHVLFFLLTVAALILAERRRPGWAGLLLACAAAVKITPAVFVVYWLLTRRWKAAASMAAWSAALWIVTLLTTGTALAHSYLVDLHRVSRILLLAENNQSFAARAMSFFYPVREVLRFEILPLPDAVRIGCMALMLACAVFGAFVDRRAGEDGSAAPLGAMMTLIGATVFAPIAWTHYSIVLIAPLMILAQRAWYRRSRAIALSALFVAALNFKPLAVDIETQTIGPHALIRSELYAALFCMLVLAAIAWRSHALHGEGEAPVEALVGDEATPIRNRQVA